MMHTWFECKIRYEKTMDNGMNKKVTEIGRASCRGRV